MRLEIKDYCIRCGICEDLYPELFHFNCEDDCIEILYEEVPKHLEPIAYDAMKDCAIAAIHIKKES